MTRLLLATSNRGKVAEFQELLAGGPTLAGITVLTLRDLKSPVPEVEETAATFAENARLKAVGYAAVLGLPCLADDSGLCVDALGGAPGVQSARWAGPTDADRNAALLGRLRDVPDPQRAARFVCALCCALPDGALVEAEGACYGVIAEAPAGENGFGYDPLFWLPKLGLTFAQLTAEQKNNMSHRAGAMALILPKLPGLLGTFASNQQ
jgi:non-canonical purine NTP pyrophosphatase (RdgB/HAM1 family)